jgi:hypothetical protein
MMGHRRTTDESNGALEVSDGGAVADGDMPPGVTGEDSAGDDGSVDTQGTESETIFS